MSAPRRPRLLVFNQYYAPGYEATAQLLAELCEALARDFDVTVVTGRLYGPEEEAAGAEWRNGVRVLRVQSTAYERERLWRRGANYVTYALHALRSGLMLPRPDVVLCMTDPPFLADVALLVARRFRVPIVVISQDVFPEIATQLQRLRNPAIVALLRWLVGFYLRRADRVVAIGGTMRRRLEEKGAPPERVRVIPNWIDTDFLSPKPRDNEWAVEQQLVGRFVVMHSGNVGHAQDLESLVRASTFLRDLEDLEIVIVGMGARRAALIQLATRLDVDRVRFLPYQPRATLPLSLAAADLHVVGLARGLAGFVVPSRLYGVLAAARPVVAAAEGDSETAQLVERVGCGVVVPPGRPERLAAAIRDAHGGRLALAEMGRRAREYVVAEADRKVAVERYRAVLDEVRSEDGR